MNLNLVSKHRAALYGFSIIYILIFHSTGTNGVDWSFGHKSLQVVQLIISHGNVGVDIFLFLSGISLYYSFSNNGDYYAFIKRRLKRVVPPTWLILAGLWIAQCVVIDFQPAKLLARFSLLNLWFVGDRTIWYVSLIIPLYFLYPYIYKYLFTAENDDYLKLFIRWLIAMVITYAVITVFYIVNQPLFDKTEIALTRIPVFLLGCFFGKLVHDGLEVPKAVIPFLVCAVVFFYFVIDLQILKGIQVRFFYLVGAIPLCYCLAILFDAIHRITDGMGVAKRPIYSFLAFTGAFSLELYLAQIMLKKAFGLFDWYDPSSLLQYAILAVLAFAVAFIAFKITNGLFSKKPAVVKHGIDKTPKG